MFPLGIIQPLENRREAESSLCRTARAGALSSQLPSGVGSVPLRSSVCHHRRCQQPLQVQSPPPPTADRPFYSSHLPSLSASRSHCYPAIEQRPGAPQTHRGKQITVHPTLSKTLNASCSSAIAVSSPVNLSITFRNSGKFNAPSKLTSTVSTISSSCSSFGCLPIYESSSFSSFMLIVPAARK
jgi:hypothetical protein